MSSRALKALAILCMVTALAAVVAIAAWTQTSAYLTRPGPARAETMVVLPRGAGLQDIAGRLADAGVIDHPWLFRLAVRALGRDRDLKAGEYAFPPKVAPETVIGMVAGGETVARRLTVAEGMTVTDVFRLLEEAEGLRGPLPPPPPEGSLLPETYFYGLGDRRAELVRRMEKDMRAALDEAWAARAEGLPFASPEEALILASIVDKETAVAAERQTVAAVFINRLRKGMRLQADPTVIYGLTGGQGPLGRPLNRQDWKHDSAYNTYRITGLPPGPIGNPGRAAIAAVLDPAPVDYLYFVADGSGGHAFARTLAEHNRNVDHWRKVKNGTRSGHRTPSPAKPSDAG